MVHSLFLTFALSIPKMMMIIIMISLVLVMPCVDAGDASDKKPITYKVGGSNGWDPDGFFFIWASDIEFHIGDWLLFEYNQSLGLSVLVVNETNYDSCRSEDPIQNITGGFGHDLFQLSSKQTYYFISGGGYCEKGVKVFITVKVKGRKFVSDLIPLPSGHRRRSTFYIVLDVVIAVSVTVAVAVSIIGWRIYRQRNIS